MAVLLHQSYRKQRRGHVKLQKAFQFQHEQLRFAYPENFLQATNEKTFDLYVPTGIKVRVMGDNGTMLLSLPSTSISGQNDLSDSALLTDKTVAYYNYLINRISVNDDSPLITLARMNGVPLPKSLQAMSPRQFEKFFTQLQNAVYGPCEMKLYFHKDWGNNYNLTRAQARKENGYTEFFMASLFAAAHGGKLSFQKYVELFSTHLELVEKTSGKTASVVVDLDERNHALMILTHPELLNDDAAFSAAMGTPLSLLEEIYAA